jgi:hypothetical protein
MGFFTDDTDSRPPQLLFFGQLTTGTSRCLAAPRLIPGDQRSSFRFGGCLYSGGIYLTAVHSARDGTGHPCHDWS